MASIYPWQGKMVHEFDSLSRDAKLFARDKDKVIWSPAAAGVEFKPVPKAPAPAKTAVERLRQMKTIAESFKATMTGWAADNTDQESLRFRPTPLYHYKLANVKDPDPKLLDGALFAYVQGTDPEIVLLLEAIGTAEKAEWQYACVRATSGGLEMKLGDEVVWTAKKHPANRDPKLPHFSAHRLLDKVISAQLFRKRGETVTRLAIRILFCAGVMFAALLVGSAAPADPPKAPDEKKADPEKAAAADEEHRRAAEKIVAEIEVEILVADKWTKVKRIEKPLLYYGDPTRANDRGSVWGWGEKGRPVALIELYQNVNNRSRWVHAICNTSGGKVRASRAGDPWWRENESASELKEIPGAPAPAAEAAQRQRQLKQLAGKFTGHEFWDPNDSRFELRRLERPLHTYRDEENGILDGALYTLANGTNPELMLFVEARTNPKDATKSAWQFTVGRLAHAELHLLYDEKGSVRGSARTGHGCPPSTSRTGSASSTSPSPSRISNRAVPTRT